MNDNETKLDQALAEVSEAADLCEALSSRYTDSARVLRLSSGAWAVFDGLGRGASCQVVTNAEDLLAAIDSAQQTSVSDYLRDKAEDEERVRTVPRTQATSKTAEDLDL